MSQCNLVSGDSLDATADVDTLVEESLKSPNNSHLVNGNTVGLEDKSMEEEPMSVENMEHHNNTVGDSEPTLSTTATHIGDSETGKHTPLPGRGCPRRKRLKRNSKTTLVDGKIKSCRKYDKQSLTHDDSLDYSDDASDDDLLEAAKSWKLGQKLGLTTHDESKVSSEIIKLRRSNRLKKGGFGWPPLTLTPPTRLVFLSYVLSC